MIENIKAIEALLQLPEGTLQSAIATPDNVTVELPELEVFRKEDYSARIENLKGTFQKQGQDFLIKEAKEKLGLEFEGKGFDKFTDAFQKKVLADAKLDPDEKSKALLADLDKLRANLAEKDNAIASIEASYKRKETDRFVNDTLLSKINIETAIPKEDVLLILKSKFGVDVENDQIVFKNGSDVLKNATTLNPLTVDEVFATFLPAYAKQVTGGSGSGDDIGKVKQGSLEAFQKEMNQKGVTVGSTAFNSEMQKRIAEKTLNL